MYTTTARKRVSPVTEAESEAQSRFSMEAMPNSAILPMAGVPSGRPDASSDLGNRIRQRLPGVQERAQAQIATAEQEADRLSASVTSGSPEAVKAAMGRKLGADFSGVRFHTGANDAARATAKGARAYTSGADIYFGEGGFDPSVAAHELVHTAQQGMVESAVATVSTPVGGIQMEPETQPRRQKRKGLDRVTHTIERLDDKITDKTVGRLARWDKEAIDELHAAKTSGTWDQLNKKQKAAWIARNPVAYSRYKKDARVREKAAARVQKRAAQEAAVGAFLEKRWATDGKKRSFIRDAQNPQASGAQGATPTYHVGAVRGELSDSDTASAVASEVLDRAGAVSENVGSERVSAGFGMVGNLQTGIEEGTEFVSAVQEGRAGDALEHGTNFASNAKETYENIQGVMGDGVLPEIPDEIGDAVDGGLSLFGDAKNSVKDSVQFVKAVREGRAGDAVVHGASFAANAEKVYEDFQGIMGDKIPCAPAGVGEVLGGGVKIAKGAKTAYEGGVQEDAMNTVSKQVLNGRTRDELSDEDVLKHDIAIQGRDQGRIMMVKGSGEAVEGVFQAGAGAAELSGVGAVAAPVLKAGAYAAKGATKVATHALHDKLKGTVTEQTTSINRDLIKDYLDSQGLDHNEKNIREAKRAMMRYMGFSTGYREELLADQSAKRAQKIVEGANAGDEQYIEMIKAMGGKTDENGRYTAEGLRERLGSDQTREQVVGSTQRIDAMAAASRGRRLAQEDRLRQDLERRRAKLAALQQTTNSSSSYWQRRKLAKKEESVRKTEADLNRRVEKNRRFGYHP